MFPAVFQKVFRGELQGDPGRNEGPGRRKKTCAADLEPNRCTRRRKDERETPKQSAAELRSDKGSSVPRYDPPESDRPEPEIRSLRPRNAHVRRQRGAVRPGRGRSKRRSDRPSLPTERGGAPARRSTECRRSAEKAKPRGKIVFYCSSNCPCPNFIGRAQLVNAAGR